MWNFVKTGGYGLTSSVLNLMYPSICPICKGRSDSYSHSPICLNCWKGIEQYSGPSCRICASPLVSEYSTVCGECINALPPFSMVLNYGIYSGVLAEAINLMKFYGVRRLTRPLGRFFLSLEIPECDGIVPVPLSKKGLRARGFNQTLLLARVISKELRIPLLMDMLFKKKDTPPQIGLNAKERLKNLRGVFETCMRIDNLRLLLLDDVMTTGATVRECSKTLIKAGAREVIVITLARSSMM
ncbi:MAG: ComF family protein [Nitrospirae bacterium]|nr:ComF family protein [Nitrospirota bacterium]